MKHLIVQLWRSSYQEPDLATKPLLLAITAAAMNMEVEIHVIGSSIELLRKNHPASHHPIGPTGRSMSSFIQDAVRTGVQFKVCSTALRESELELIDLVDGVTEVIGMVTMIDRATDLNTTVLTF